MEHLTLEIFDLSGTGSKFAYLPEDASITITDTSEVFASGDVWSYSFSLNVKANAHIFGSSGDMHGSRLHDQLNRRKARLWVEQTPMFLGYLTLGDEVDVDEDGNVDVGFESGQKTFDDMIEGAKANQVPMINDVRIGLALWRKRWTKFKLRLSASAIFEGGTSSLPGYVFKEGSDCIEFSADGEDDLMAVQEYPRMVFPKGVFKNADTDEEVELDCVNTDYPYDDAHPYCNVALCYQKTGYEKKDKDGNVITDYSGEPEAQRGYEVMPANRINSAPNFYVMYWIKALMHHLGIYIEEDQMVGVEDLKRLFFVNTKCAYREPKHIRNNPDEGFGRYKFVMGYHHLGYSGRLVPEFYGPKKRVKDEAGESFDADFMPRIAPEECGFVCKNITIVEGRSASPIDHLNIDVSGVLPWSLTEKINYEDKNGWLHDAFATPECFPDVDIKEVIEALESGFGIRFLFSENYRRVRIVLLRNLFRNHGIQDIACDVISEKKTENAIRGFKMTYGESTDTTFYYKGFNDMLPHKTPYFKDNSDTHDYSHWNLDADYGKLINKISAFDKTCYVTKNTGNAYGIKIDKDAKRYDELHPSLFEYAGYMDAEDGDCTGEDDTIETVSVGFKPAIMNDINFENERGKDGKGGENMQKFALFVGEDMRPRRPDLKDGQDYNAPDAYYDMNRLYADDSPAANMKADDGVVKPGEFFVTSDMYATATNLRAIVVDMIHNLRLGAKFDLEGHINEGYRLYLQDNYEPNDEGICAVEKHDWGLTLGIMRGSGDDARVDYRADPDDGEGNDTWEKVAGTNVAAHPDTCDAYGNLWDYNGEQEGLGPDDRISLKLRAEKLNPYYDPESTDPEKQRQYLEITKDSLKGRGLADTFYKEYSYWIRNARTAKMTVRMELSQLLAIDKTKKVRVGDITGFIRKMQYTVSKKNGLGMVTLEIMYI